MQDMNTATPQTENTENEPDYSHIELSYVVPVYFTTGNTQSLTDLLHLYAGYKQCMMNRVQFVVVDDCSPTPPIIPDDLDLNILLLRIIDDIPWNQAGARNLGITYARSDKVFLTDLDHEIPEDTFRQIMMKKNPGRTMYKLKRVNPDGTPRRAHPNTFVLSRARFMRLYGYDEVFAGHYGYDDAILWRWQRYNGTRFLYMPKGCYARLRSLDKEAEHTLVRDLEHNKAIAAKAREAWKTFGPAAGHTRQFLNFRWEVIMDRQRSTRPPMPGPRRPWWVKTWWWRWLVGGP